MAEEIAIGNLLAGKGTVTKRGGEGSVRLEVFERTGGYLRFAMTNPHVDSLKRHIRSAPRSIRVTPGRSPP